jgi:hypothetical protein
MEQVQRGLFIIGKYHMGQKCLVSHLNMKRFETTGFYYVKT